MSKSNINLTNDDINSEIRNDNEDSINFFSGTEITILHKNVSEPVSDEVQNEIDGLETLILSFSASRERLAFNEALLGGEDRYSQLPEERSIFIRIIEEVMRFLRGVAEWIWSLLVNRIRRAENRLVFLEQRRKGNGIRNYPVKYLRSVQSLLIPSISTASPTWVLSNATQGLNFYKRSIAAHKKLIEFIGHKPNSREELRELKLLALTSVGGIITNGNRVKDEYTTDVLPGNRVFHVALRTTEKEGNPFYFLNYPGAAVLKTDYWTPTSGLISNGLDLLKEYIKEIKKEQSTTTTLTRNFEQQIRAAKKGASNWTIVYYNWLIELNRKFVSITFYSTMRWFDALEQFISSGVH